MNQQVLEQKKEVVNEINNLLKTSHSTIVVSYSGLSVDEVNKLRHDLKENGARLSVRKNTLLRKAIDEDGLSALDECLKGPSAIVTSEQEGAGLSVLNDFYEHHKKVFKIKGGVIGGNFVNQEQIAYLAPIGTKENAISVLLSTMQSPLVTFALTLKALGEKAQ